MSLSTVGGSTLACGLHVRSLDAGPGHRPRWRRRGRPLRHRFNSVGGYDSGPHNAHYSVDAGDLNANVMARTTAQGKALMLSPDKGVIWKRINDDQLAALLGSLHRSSPGAAGWNKVHIDACAFVHRFGSSLNTQVHFHWVVVDAARSSGAEANLPLPAA